MNDVIHLDIEIPTDRIKDIVINAMEMACGYWARVTDESSSTLEDYYDRLFMEDGWIRFKIIDEPLIFGNDKVLIKDLKILNLLTIRSGLAIMADKYPRHFGDLISENDDADTADVFLQCCLLGDVVYG